VGKEEGASLSIGVKTPWAEASKGKRRMAGKHVREEKRKMGTSALFKGGGAGDGNTRWGLPTDKKGCSKT